MSDPATPWWADVQHLRPREDRAPRTPAPPASRSPETPAPPAPRSPSRRFERAAQQHQAAVATLEPAVESWDEPADEVAPAAAEPRTPVWDDSFEEAFARTPSWAEDEEWLLPKGANRIENGRRTIEIRGQVDRIHGFTPSAETTVATRTGRRPSRRASERFERRPDRVAMWAFLLGLFLIAIAAFSKPGDADASTRAVAAATPAAQVAVLAADGTLHRAG